MQRMDDVYMVAGKDGYAHYVAVFYRTVGAHYAVEIDGAFHGSADSRAAIDDEICDVLSQRGWKIIKDFGDMEDD